jgi:hypothetical protein
MNVASLIVFAVAAVGWFALIVKILEWRDWHADVARARQHRMGPVDWVKTNTIAALSPTVIWAIFLLGLAVIGWAAWQIPYLITTGTSAGLILAGLRQTPVEPTEIQQLRAALGEIIGKNEKDQPPKVTLDGEHPSGGPLHLTIEPIPGWQYWKKEVWNSLERAVEYRMDGDWENVVKSVDGIVWERLPEFPELAPYTEHFDLPWYQIPIGDDGLGNIRCIDLHEYAHWGIFGDNGSGKTTAFGVAGTHLLNHRDEADTVIIDIKGFGLKRFAGREGVVYEALFDYDATEAAFEWLRQQVDKRKQELALHNRFLKPLVVLWDEAEENMSDANMMGKRLPKVEHPVLIMNAMTIGRLARELGIYLIVGMQRADGTSIPTKFRAQLRGRVQFGATDEPGARMAVGQTDAARVVNMPTGVGINVIKGMNWIGYTKGLWLANPLSDKETDKDRKRAEMLLPPKRSVRIPDSGATMVTTSTHAGEDVGNSSFSKREPLNPTTGRATVATEATGLATEGPLERFRRVRRDQKRKERAEGRLKLRDPDCEWHGTKKGYELGCRCKRCMAWKVQADQPVLEVAS